MRGYLYLWYAVCLLTGILTARFLGAWSLLAAAVLAAAVFAAIVLKRDRYRTLLIPLAFMVMGIALLLPGATSARNGVLARGARARMTASVVGRVLTAPSENGSSTGMFVEVGYARLGARRWRLSERLYLSVERRLEKGLVYAGVEVEAGGRLEIPRGGGRWLEDHGAACLMRVTGAGLMRTNRPPDVVSCLIEKARSHLAKSYRRVMTRRVAGFVEAVTLSRLDETDPGIIADLRACGLSHIVAVSGLHVGSAAAIALALAGALGAGRRARYSVAAATAFAVLCLAGFRVSATRAAFMAAMCFAGAATGRRYDPLVSVSVAGIIILCVNPRAAFDPGFQYSFAAVLGIVLLAGWGRSRVGKNRWRSSIAVCAGAQLGTLPLLLLGAGFVPISAIVANLLVVWLIGLLMISGLSAALLSGICLPVARIVALLPVNLSRYVLSVASWCARIPGAGLSGGLLSVCALLLYVASLVMLARSAREGTMTRAFIALGVSVLLVICGCYPVIGVRSETSMTVLDVGQGDATLLRDGGAVVLVDGGPDPELILRKLKARGVNKIDLMIATHPHLDHVAGLVEVVRSMPVGMLLEPGVSRSSPEPYRCLFEEARKRGVRTMVGREGQLITPAPGIELEVLYSPASLDRIPENLNDCSIVCMAYMGGSSILLTGDLEAEGQDRLLEAHPSIACDVIKIPHQGAADAATDELIEAARPRLAAISVGRNNMYGHPSAKCLEMLRGHGIAVARTDMTGDVVISLGNGRIGLETGGRGWLKNALRQ